MNMRISIASRSRIRSNWIVIGNVGMNVANYRQMNGDDWKQKRLDERIRNAKKVKTIYIATPAPELARGLEPLTFGLQIRCSTS